MNKHFSYQKELSRYKTRLLQKILKTDWSWWGLIFLATLFSSYIMFVSFSYKNGVFWVHYKSWSDFLNHIPLIRSFSYGSNWPPEYPLFTGERIRYHFAFYWLVGMLERFGLRLDLALNILSIIGLVGLILGIYWLAVHLTAKKKVGWLAVIFMLFNSSWSWLYYFGEMGGTGLQLSSFNDFFANQRFAAFGPYNNTVISAFWTLNIFTNQRHLALSMSLVLLISYLVLYRQGVWTLVISVVLIGLMAWLHKAMLLIIFVLLGLSFLWQSNIRKRVFITTLLGIIIIIPGILYLNGSAHKTISAINWHWGYLYNATTWKDFPLVDKIFPMLGKNVTINPFKRWLWYWLVNLGLTPFLAIGGYLLLIKQNVKIKQQHLWFSLTILLFFIINSLSLATDVGTNHKFANFMMYIINIYAAYLITYLWETNTNLSTTKKYKSLKRWDKQLNLNKIFLLCKPIGKKTLSLGLIIGLTFGGILDFYPLINDHKGALINIKQHPTAQWIVENTLPKAKFLSLTYKNEPITITGRRLFLGFDYFPWSIGYPTQARRDQLNPIVKGNITATELCSFLQKHQLSYIYLDLKTDNFIDLEVNNDYFLKNYPSAHHWENNYIFSKQNICQSKIKTKK